MTDVKEHSQIHSSKNISIVSTILKVFAYREVGVLIALGIIVVFFSVLSPPFLSLRNIVNILRQASELGIIAIAVSTLIISGEFDLSVGSVYGLVGITMGILVKNYGVDVWTSLLLCLFIAAAIGFMNGVITTKVGINSFITTLGSMMLLRGIALVISFGWPISGLPETVLFSIFGRARLFDILPIPVLWLVIVGLVGWYLVHFTSFGIKVFATGGNREASRYSGINVDRVRIIAFIMASLATGLASIISLSFLMSVTPTQGTGLELQVIAAAVIGGTSLRGGVGSVFGAILGALIIATVRNGLVMIGTDAYWQGALIGLILVLAAAMNVQLEKRLM